MSLVALAGGNQARRVKHPFENVGGGSSAPSPGGGDTVVWDTTSGGAHDIQAAANISAANSASGISPQSLPPSGHPEFTVPAVSLATAFENSSGGRAYVLPWEAFGGNSECESPANSMATHRMNLEKSFTYAQMPGAGKKCWYQYKMWLGRTTNGGGQGTVGDYYDETVARKWHTFARRKSDGNSTQDGRITMEQSSSTAKIIVASYTEYTGPAPGDEGAITDGRWWGTGLSGTEWVSGDHLNEAITVSIGIKTETAANAQDGTFEMWINATRLFLLTSQYTCHHGFTGLQIGGPTFACPPRDATKYVWDMKAWHD